METDCTAGRRGGAGLGRTGRRRGGSPWRQPFILRSSASRTSETIVMNVSSTARTNEFVCEPVESQTRTYHGRVWAGRRGGAGQSEARRGPAGRVGTPACLFAQESTVPVALEDNCSERFFGSTNNEFLCKPMGEESPRLRCGSSAVYPRDDGRSSFLAADQWTDAYLSL